MTFNFLPCMFFVPINPNAEVNASLCAYSRQGYTFTLDKRINPFPNKSWFLRVCSTSLLKTMWKKEKLLVTLFSTQLENFLPFLLNFKLLSANSLSLEESKSCRLGKG